MHMTPRRLALAALQRAAANAGSGKVMLRSDEAALIARVLRSAVGGDGFSACLLQADGLPCICGGGRAECEYRLTVPGLS